MIEIIVVSAKELEEMDRIARERELKAFADDPSIKMPFTGFAKNATVEWYK